MRCGERSQPSPIIAAIVGMKAEAKILPFGISWRCSGGIPRNAERQAEELICEGADYLVSFGVAGGLAPQLLPGTLIIGSGIYQDGVVLVTDKNWSSQIASLLPEAKSGIVAGSRTVIATTSEKKELYEKSGAIAVDMESWALASVCQAWGKPFVILRAIADPAWCSVPTSAMAGLQEDGSISVMSVIRELCSRPSDMLGLLRLARANSKAMAALRFASGSLGVRNTPSENICSKA